MNAKFLSKLKWAPLSDDIWEKIPKTSREYKGGNLCSESSYIAEINNNDLEVFLERTYRDMALQLSIPYEDFLKLLKKKIIHFINRKNYYILLLQTILIGIIIQNLETYGLY